MHVAAAKGDVKLVQWLLARGADRQFKNFKQVTPLDVARSAAVLEILQGPESSLELGMRMTPGFQRPPSFSLLLR